MTTGSEREAAGFVAEQALVGAPPGRLSRKDPRPLHRQVHSAILAAIEEGRLPENGKIPSERELVEIFGVSRITVRHAMRDLVQQGFLHSQPGKGFYVAGPVRGFELHLLKSFTSTALANGRRPGSRLLEGRVCRAPLEIARPLFLPAGAEVVVLSRLRLLDGMPVAIQTDWLSAVRVPGLLDLDWSGENRSLYAELRQHYRIRPMRGQTTLSARLATEEEAERLDLDPPAAVLTVDQIAFDAKSRPVNLSTMVHHPARYPLTLVQSESGDIEQL